MIEWTKDSLFHSKVIALNSLANKLWQRGLTYVGTGVSKEDQELLLDLNLRDLFYIKKALELMHHVILLSILFIYLFWNFTSVSYTWLHD